MVGMRQFVLVSPFITVSRIRPRMVVGGFGCFDTTGIHSHSGRVWRDTLYRSQRTMRGAMYASHPRHAATFTHPRRPSL